MHAMALVVLLAAPFDEGARGNFSASAAHASDLLVTVTALAPVLLQVGRDGGDQRALIHGETLAVTLAANALVKRLVGRPRPYTYDPDARVQGYARDQGDDAHLSFYSGHAATAFAAAVSGATLFAHASDDPAARAAGWATGLFFAGATADLRVRAGKHFPSDVLVGALAGAGVGVLLPALQLGVVRPSGPEWVAIAIAPFAGAALAHLVPMPRDITLPLPWTDGKSAGLMLRGRF